MIATSLPKGECTTSLRGLVDSLGACNYLVAMHWHRAPPLVDAQGRSDTPLRLQTIEELDQHTVYWDPSFSAFAYHHALISRFESAEAVARWLHTHGNGKFAQLEKVLRMNSDSPTLEVFNSDLVAPIRRVSGLYEQLLLFKRYPR